MCQLRCVHHYKGDVERNEGEGEAVAQANVGSDENRPSIERAPRRQVQARRRRRAAKGRSRSVETPLTPAPLLADHLGPLSSGRKPMRGCGKGDSAKTPWHAEGQVGAWSPVRRTAVRSSSCSVERRSRVSEAPVSEACLSPAMPVSLLSPSYGVSIAPAMFIC